MSTCRASCSHYFELFIQGYTLKATLDRPLIAHSNRAFIIPVERLDWREVNSPVTLQDYCTVAANAFDIPDWLVPKILTESFVAQHRVKRVVAYVDGTAAAAAMVIKEHGLAGIYGTGTKKGFERPGFEAKTTTQALHLSIEMGCRWSILQASKKGKPAHERTGYTVGDHYHYFVYQPTA